ncbi:penicillin acylase family protein [Streptomyces parvulus]|uniref:penicillin acylase family protein n=1 Tax=Streptomyces parvulus TaxID=146923 RepID=UPI001E5C7B92|nr:penicillin acylase family protein [Streptomyces parvulus]MCC9158677.1 penicillin acylase family protein [Streptomyces parvulus]MCE7691571.1 penicillin acylase family protein [Streptomyces parvulus]
MARKVGRAIHLVCSTTVALALLLLLGAGYGPVPALGTALVPGGGVWASSSARTTVRTETLTLPELEEPVRVSFTAEGYASIEARTDHDLFLAQGYVTARLRLTQLDLQRRMGQGRLSELVGAAGLESDRFELSLGLARTARARWAAIPENSDSAKALTAYSEGVNSWMSSLRKTGEWPTIYGLTGVRPRPWTPTDTLVVQGVLTQQMNFNTIPLDYELLNRSLGPELTRTWFPVQAPTAQRPYDPGPYRNLPPTPLTVRNTNAADPDAAPTTPARPTPGPASAHKDVALPDSVRQLDFNSNAWAANGPKAAGGGAILAGDPHLQTTLPSYWFQVSLRSPGYQVTGGSLPGVPGVLVGHNKHISWSLTNAQTVGTLYYREKLSPDRPDSYFWRGAWRPMEKAHYTIPVRGGSTEDLTVDLTVHGPMMTVLDQKVSVNWMGNYAHNDLNALLAANRASDWTSFRTALRGWKAPALNFVYADDRGHIGTLLAGDVPQTPKGSRPWLPLPGTGTADVVGTIPQEALPEAYDPPGHLVASTNQRPTGPDYPYFLGTTMNFDPGYRQAVIERFHTERRGLRTEDYTALQNDVTDDLAVRLLPALLTALDGSGLTARQRAARDLLTTWDHTMGADSAAASVWWTFLDSYVHEVFQPWWDRKKVPADKDRWILDLDRSPIPLREALEHWTLDDPDNAAFTPPDGARRDAPQAMRTAFRTAVAELTDELGDRPAAWTWGKLHTREIPSITGAPGLGYEPYADGGNPWTVDAAGGELNSSFGPSFRLVVRWTGPGSAAAAAIYPGGQNETPGSAWYDNLVALWRKDEYLPLRPPNDAAGTAATWSLRAGD